MPATVLTDLNAMTTEDIVMAMSSIVATNYWDRMKVDGEPPEDLEQLRRLTDELERRLVNDKYLN